MDVGGIRGVCGGSWFGGETTTACTGVSCEVRLWLWVRRMTEFWGEGPRGDFYGGIRCVIFGV